MRILFGRLLLCAGVLAAGEAAAQDIKIALLAGRTGPLEAYAKQTEAGLDARPGVPDQRHDGGQRPQDRDPRQGRPGQARSRQIAARAGLRRRQGGYRRRHDLLGRRARHAADRGGEQEDADRRAGGRRLDHRRQVEPLRLPHRRAIRRRTRSPPRWRSARASISVATLAQDYAFGRDGVAALKEALADTKSTAKVVFEEYAPQTTTDFTASAQRLFDALKDKPGRKVIAMIWAGPHPLTKIADLKPERFGIELAPGGNILPAMKPYRNYPGMEGADLLLLRLPEEPDERLAGRRAPEALQRAARLLHRRRHVGRGARSSRRSRRPAAPTPRS